MERLTVWQAEVSACGVADWSLIPSGIGEC
jgi:hypothetical protein